jgi:hypothetical protein
MMNKPQTYDTDFYAWALYNADLIRQGKFAEVDIHHVAEELESMGKSERRELISRFAVLLAHLLKWQYQPERRGNSWKYTIKEQRFEVEELLDDSPSLNHELDEQLAHAYKKALLLAIQETGLNPETFPEHCPFSFTQAMAIDYFPE